MSIHTDHPGPSHDGLPRAFGPYVLRRVLGTGGTGIVYEGVQRALDRRVAVKVLRDDLRLPDAALRRFAREARALARVQHPHVVPVYDAGVIDGMPFFAMALVDGHSLLELAEGAERPDPREVAAWLAPVADALETLHAAGILHRDVKPGNLVQTATGRVVLTDFSLARDDLETTLTRPGAMLGTPAWMSPEQLGGDPGEVDARTDVYGLGATLYHLLSGRPPYRAETTAALLRLVAEGRPPALREVAPDVPRELERIVMTCLEPRPEDRYASAGAVRDDLLAFARGEPVQGRPVGAPTRALRALRRRAWPLAAAALLLVVGGWFWLHRAAHLEVTTVAQANVLVDGVVRGVSPARLDLAPGTYVIGVEHALFEPWAQEVPLTAGQRRGIRLLSPVPRRMDDPEALALLAQLHEVPWRRFEEVSMPRSAAATPRITAVYPRGRVWARDLLGWRVEVAEAPPEGARIVFRRAGETLHEAPFAPEDLVTEGPFPPEVASRVRPGDLVTWGCVCPEGQVVLATVEIVAQDPEVSERVARIESAYAHAAPGVAAALAGRILLDADLPYGAFVRARRAAETRPESLLPWAIMEEALRTLGATRSRAWAHAYGTIHGRRFSEAQREVWYGPPHGP